MNRIALLGSLSVVLFGAALMAQTPTATTTPAPQSEVDAHIAAARAAMGMDFRNTFINLCLPAGGRGGARGAAADAGGRGAGAPAGRGGDPAAAGRGGAGRGAAAGQAAGGRGGGGAAQTQDPNTYAPPFKIFDNFYWLGTRAHSSWALQTSAGIIIIDTNFAWATEPEIIGGLTKLGLNPADIKFVIISHAHGDHDQGAAELQKRFGAKVVMGAADWESTLQRPATAAGGVPTKDIAVGPEGYKLTLGDTTVDIVPTPGHTPGTLSYVFPVRHQGKTVTVAYSGGTLTGNFGTDAKRWDEYIASQQKIAKTAADAGATIILSNHSEYDGAYTKARLIAAPRQAGEDHPFIVGANGVQRYFTVMAECATASKLRNGAK
jgi:metallo-beta-lactamase class B